MPDGAYGGNPGGFVIESDEGNFYYSGDTALTYDMKLIGESHQLDFAILCLGDNFTMGYKDAARAADFVQVHKVVGMHFDTFGYIKVDHEAVEDYFNAEGKVLKLPQVGETFEI
jgi:L-ascorbate metabolism protein UlaG (beta-lactamase superfamily)